MKESAEPTGPVAVPPVVADLTVTLGQLVNASTATGNAAPALASLGETKLPGKQSYRLAKLLKDIGAELKIYEEERIKMLDRLGVRDEKTNQYIFPTPEAGKAFSDELKELLETKVVLHHIPMPELIEAVSLSANDMLALDWLFQE